MSEVSRKQLDCDRARVSIEIAEQVKENILFTCCKIRGDI